MRSKKGLELSFSMIFSIIVIIAILGVAFYMISYFLKLKSCTELGLYGKDLQDKIDRAWNADSSQEIFEENLPSFVSKVCIGNLEQGTSAPEYGALERFRLRGANLFFYPVPGCDIQYKKLDHAKFNGFDCIPVKSGKVQLKIVKGPYDSLVSVCKTSDTSCGISAA